MTPEPDTPLEMFLPTWIEGAHLQRKEKFVRHFFTVKNWKWGLEYIHRYIGSWFLRFP
jgi:hypothetical protein